jgi:hypothetical protein
MNDPVIVGFMETSKEKIYFCDVLGIYADRGTPRKTGHWVKIYDSDKPKGMYKLYVEGLTQEQRKLLEAAAKFNQVVGMLSRNTVTSVVVPAEIVAKAKAEYDSSPEFIAYKAKMSAYQGKPMSKKDFDAYAGNEFETAMNKAGEIVAKYGIEFKQLWSL